MNRESRNSPSGTIGSRTLDSTTRKETSSTPAVVSSTIMVGDVQPKCSDSTIAKVRTQRPDATSTAPPISSLRASGLRDSRTPLITRTSPMIPMGTFTQNTADQENSSTRMPPTTGPAPNPNPAAAAQIPMAAVRRSGG